jgi:hypothetical protein
MLPVRAADARHGNKLTSPRPAGMRREKGKANDLQIVE